MKTRKNKNYKQISIKVPKFDIPKPKKLSIPKKPKESEPIKLRVHPLSLDDYFQELKEKGGSKKEIFDAIYEKVCNENLFKEIINDLRDDNYDDNGVAEFSDKTDREILEKEIDMILEVFDDNADDIFDRKAPSLQDLINKAPKNIPYSDISLMFEEYDYTYYLCYKKENDDYEEKIKEYENKMEEYEKNKLEYKKECKVWQLAEKEFNIKLQEKLNQLSL